MKKRQTPTLTHEALRGLFRDNFQLTNQAIALCRYYMQSGHEVSMDKILQEVRRNPSEHYLRDLMALDSQEDDSTEK